MTQYNRYSNYKSDKTKEPCPISANKRKIIEKGIYNRLCFGQEELKEKAGKQMKITLGVIIVIYALLVWRAYVVDCEYILIPFSIFYFIIAILIIIALNACFYDNYREDGCFYEEITEKDREAYEKWKERINKKPVPQPKPKPAPQPQPKPAPLPQPKPAPLPQPKPAPQPQPQPKPTPQPQPKPAPLPPIDMNGWENVKFQADGFNYRINGEYQLFRGIEDATNEAYNDYIKELFDLGKLPIIKVTKIVNGFGYSINHEKINKTIKEVFKPYHLKKTGQKNNQTHSEIRKKAYEKYEFLGRARYRQKKIENYILKSHSEYLKYLFEHQTPDREIIETQECISHKTNPNIVFDNAFVFTLENYRYYFVIYENVRPGTSSIVCRVDKHNEAKYYEIIDTIIKYMISRTKNKRQELHKKNQIGNISVTIIYHNDINEWKTHIQYAVRNF